MKESLTVRTESFGKYLTDIARLQTVSPEEEAELCYRAQAGDKDAMEALIKANLRFVVTVAKQYQNRGLNITDLISEGNLGMITAAKKFDPTKGYKFISYAVWWIRQSIRNALTESGNLIRIPDNQIHNVNRVKDAENRYRLEHGREPGLPELSKMTSLREDRIAKIKNTVTDTVRLDAPVRDEDYRQTLQDILTDESTEPTDSALNRESLAKDAIRALMILNRNERNIVTRIFGIGRPEETIRETADNLGISRERVRQVKEEALEKLRRSQRVTSILKQYR